MFLVNNPDTAGVRFTSITCNPPVSRCSSANLNSHNKNVRTNNLYRDSLSEQFVGLRMFRCVKHEQKLNHNDHNHDHVDDDDDREREETEAERRRKRMTLPNHHTQIAAALPVEEEEWTTEHEPYLILQELWRPRSWYVQILKR